jgi:hypothetical protein
MRFQAYLNWPDPKRLGSGAHNVQLATNCSSSDRLALLLGLAAVVMLGGCAHGLRFPEPLQVTAAGEETALSFDTDGDRRPDFWEYLGPDGRKHAIAYALPGAHEPGPRIDLDAIPPEDCPHFLIALDGVPFDVVADLWQQGHFRLFRPPARVVCCFPAMTDLALSQLCYTGPCLAYQGLYYDRTANRLSDANNIYLRGLNSPWLARMSYRCSFWWDVTVYLNPQPVFDHEIDGMLQTFRKCDQGEAYGYSVGSAGLGTRGGRPAMENYLLVIDRLCEQLVHERHGRVKITLTADHGHDLVEHHRVVFDDLLKAGGYHPTTALRGPRDVVTIAYGLVTYAAFHTSDPAGVARCLLGHPDAEFACYPTADAVVVVDRNGEARITQGATGFIYDSSRGDPLQLEGVVEQLRTQSKVSAAGEIDGDALFQATIDHYYPDPLERVWGAFHGVAENVPDLILNLRDGACHGSGFFFAMVGNKVASTHGSLNRQNCTTFALTTLGELPPAMRTVELRPALERLRGTNPSP